MESDVLTEMRLATESLDRMSEASRRFQNVQADETAKLWQELAELRDGLVGVSNRVEALTRAVMADPVDVAAKIVNLVGRPGDVVDCGPCRGSGTTPMGGKCPTCEGFGKVVLAALWADNAELRDELHAVANRLENLTTFVTTSPAEVAAAIVNGANRCVKVDGRQS